MKVLCNNCSARLTVAESLSGNEVRCPSCEYVFLVARMDDEAASPDSGEADEREPASSVGDGEPSATIGPSSFSVASASQQGSAALPVSRWTVRIPEGLQFGPIDRDTLDTWVEEGRISDECQIRVEGQESWASAASLYPILDESGNPFESAAAMSNIRPHRGGLVFGLSLVGCIIPFVSIWPAVIGTRDLRLMNLGKMDSRGDAITRAGQAIAMVSSIIWVGAFAVLLLTLLVKMLSRI